MPVRGTRRVPTGAGPEIVKVAPRAPTAFGPNCIETVQVPFVESGTFTQVCPVMTKSAALEPPTMADVTVAVVPPMYFTVTVFAADFAPTTIDPKFSLAGVTWIGSSPVPARATRRIPTLPGPVMSSSPIRAPIALGLKATLTVHEAWTRGAPVQVSAVITKFRLFAPWIDSPEIVSGSV